MSSEFIKKLKHNTKFNKRIIYNSINQMSNINLIITTYNQVVVLIFLYNFILLK